MPEKVSIVLATYNGETFIKQQLESIFTQLPQNSEVIISDNGSTDGTLEIIKSYNHPKVQLLINNERRGVVNNFEYALAHTTGDIIFFSDQDDIWKPNKIAVCAEYMKTYDLLVSDCDIIDEQNTVIHNSYFSRRNSGKGIIKNLWANTYLGCCMVLNRKVLNTALPFPKSIPMHDIWLGFVGDSFFKTLFLPQALVSYRTHDKNISPTSSGISPHSLVDKFLFRWNIVKYLPALLWRRWKTYL